MIRYRDGQVRYYTILEAKRIQTFPDQYPIIGSWTEAMRQLGNAVPVDLGRRIGQSLVTVLSESRSRPVHNPEMTHSA
jgi:DNA (cytosine-5)-methyltransferase 1